ncbi:MAG: hypothetical protein QM771_07320 [Nitrospira sp.]
MALAQYSREPLNSDEARQRCLAIRDALVHAGVYGSAHTEQGTATAGSGVSPGRFRLSPTPFLLSSSDALFFQHLGQDLLAFYRALNRLYQESVRGTQPGWVAAYLDQGKPESLITFSRMNRFRKSHTRHHPAGCDPDCRGHGHHGTRFRSRRNRPDGLYGTRL